MSQAITAEAFLLPDSGYELQPIEVYGIVLAARARIDSDPVTAAKLLDDLLTCIVELWRAENDAERVFDLMSGVDVLSVIDVGTN